MDAKSEIKTLPLKRRIAYYLLKLIFNNKESDFPLDLNKIKKVLILRYDVIGDMIVSLPAIDLIKQVLPNSEIHILGSHANEKIIKYDPRIKKIHIMNGNLWGIYKLSKQTRSENFDLVFSFVFNRTTKAGIIANIFSGFKSTKTHILDIKRKHLYSLFFNLQIPLDEIKTTTMLESLNLFVARTLSVDLNNFNLNKEVILPKESFIKSNEYKNSLPDEKILLFNISAGAENRMLSMNQNSNILKFILQNYPDYQIIINYAPQHRELAESLCNINRNKIKIANDFKFLDMVAFVKLVDVIFTPDTSLIHIANSYNKPIFIIMSEYKNNHYNWLPSDSSYYALICMDDNNYQLINDSVIIEYFNKFIDNFHNNSNKIFQEKSIIYLKS